MPLSTSIRILDPAVYSCAVAVITVTIPAESFARLTRAGPCLPITTSPPRTLIFVATTAPALVTENAEFAPPVLSAPAKIAKPVEEEVDINPTYLLLLDEL